MPLRITQGILYESALRRIMQASRHRFELQDQIASGRRVRRPSDDPAATLKIMPLRSEIRDLQQTTEIIGQARASMSTATAALEDASAVMQRLRELTVQAANGTMTTGDRRAMVSEVDALLAQMLASSNARWGDKMLFAGTANDHVAFEVVEQGGRRRVVYRGNAATTSIRITSELRSEINVPGEAIFLRRQRGPTTFEGSTGVQPSGAADSGVGIGSLRIAFGGIQLASGTTGLAQGDTSTTALGALSYVYTAGSPPTLSVGGGPAQPIAGGVQSFTVGSGTDTVSLNVTGPIVPATGTFNSTATLSLDGGQTTTLVSSFGSPVQVRDSSDGSVVNVDVSGLARVGTERVVFEGTFDVFTALIAVRDMLQNDANAAEAAISTRLSAMLPRIDFAHDSVLHGLQKLGSRSRSIELLAGRLDQLAIAHQSALSKLEDADLAESIVALSSQDLAFQASLRIGARAVQTTLLDFLA